MIDDFLMISDFFLYEKDEESVHRELLIYYLFSECMGGVAKEPTSAGIDGWRDPAIGLINASVDVLACKLKRIGSNDNKLISKQKES